jgi:mannose-6-phosphate isomerase-like protein (cupin superfamily)
MFESTRGQQNGTLFFIAERSGLLNGVPCNRIATPASFHRHHALAPCPPRPRPPRRTYHIQKKRRKEFLEEWRNYRQTVIRKEDVRLEKTARGLRTGVYMGWDGDRPTRSLDALVHEVDPGVTTTVHRHSWDAILFMVEGSGWTEVDGVRYDWKAWDAIHIPAWSWHRHGNERQQARAAS